MNIRFLEPARNELDDAFDWYEMEQSDLGRHFLVEIQSAMKRITVFPDSCAFCRGFLSLRKYICKILYIGYKIQILLAGNISVLFWSLVMTQKILSPETLGTALRTERKRKKRSQTDVGRSVGIDQPTVSRVEKGNPGTELGTLFRLLAALDLELVLQTRQHPADDARGDVW